MGKLSMIVAKDKNGVIGKDNELIWHIPEDLAHFKKNTLGKTIVMGRKTYESIGKALPGRQNIVLTRDGSFIKNDIYVMRSVQEVLSLLGKGDEVVIIGGDSIYKQFIDYADMLYVTEIDKEFEGDTFFPEISRDWVRTKSQEGKDSGKDGYNYFFNEYKKYED